MQSSPNTHTQASKQTQGNQQTQGNKQTQRQTKIRRQTHAQTPQHTHTHTHTHTNATQHNATQHNAHTHTHTHTNASKCTRSLFTNAPASILFAYQSSPAQKVRASVREEVMRPERLRSLKVRQVLEAVPKAVQPGLKLLNVLHASRR